MGIAGLNSFHRIMTPWKGRPWVSANQSRICSQESNPSALILRAHPYRNPSCSMTTTLVESTTAHPMTTCFERRGLPTHCLSVMQSPTLIGTFRTGRMVVNFVPSRIRGTNRA